jgi:hypothetical protein
MHNESANEQGYSGSSERGRRLTARDFVYGGDRTARSASLAERLSRCFRSPRERGSIGGPGDDIGRSRRIRKSGQAGDDALSTQSGGWERTSRIGKSMVFSVRMMAPCTRAVPAMSASGVWIVTPRR